MAEGLNILKRFTKQWQLYLAIESLLYALGFGLFVFFISKNFGYAGIAFFVCWFVAIWLIKPWKPTLDASCYYLNSQLNDLEYSTTLLLQSNQQLHGLAKLQQHKVYDVLKSRISSIRPPHHLIKSAIIALGLMLLGVVLSQFVSFSTTTKDGLPAFEDSINFQPIDSVAQHIDIPEITLQKAILSYPDYTKLGRRSTTQMNISALEGSRITWQLQFSIAIDSVFMESVGQRYPMKLQGDTYVRSQRLENSGIYNFMFKDIHGHQYTSELYTIEVVKDKAPTIELSNIDQFNSFNYFDDKTINFNCKVEDDYGIADAYIIATVSKGSGESVKFREEKLTFNGVRSGRKSLSLFKQINLDELQMTPGDELYFYIEANDQKQPQANTSRSETYFAVIRDTTSYEFSLEGTLGVDRMPDYFRSQRQLIIDTEKLISQRGELSEHDFKFKSNELGYDQKVLRLKYAEFMGEETESGIVIEEDIEALENEDDHDHEDEATDPLAEYTHDHDNENEHNLVDEDDQKKKADELLEAYQHDHEDPEAATLYEESLKTKLRKALNEMWDAELYLRLYQPEKSLPYQYRALKYIQDIKNHARIYVHRIGFDPPPIKEDKRLTGDLEEVGNYTKKLAITSEFSFPNTQIAIERLVSVLTSESQITDEDRKCFEQAGNELAELAIENPGKHLQTLQNLKQLTVFGDHPKTLIINTLQGLLKAVPAPNTHPNKDENYLDLLDQLVLKALANDK